MDRHYISAATRDHLVKVVNPQIIAANNQRRLDREYRALMAAAMAPVRDVPAFKRSGFVEL